MSVSVPRKGVLIVRLLGQTVGRLDYSSHHNEMRFSYAPEYLANSNSMPLSRSLPLRSEPFDTETTTVFFENLLPPDQVRRKLGPILHISRHNIFGFLEALGGDCAGAISLCPENATQDEESVARLEMLDEDAAPMRTIVNRLSQSDSAEAWKQVMSVSYSRSADCICLAYYNALTEVLPVLRIL